MSDKMLKLTLDGRELEVPEGTTVMQAADRAGVNVPRFCWHPGLSIAANCRICLVDVEGVPKPLTACSTFVQDGMVVNTGSESALDARAGVMEFLLINHPLDCPVCDQAGECVLQDHSQAHGSGHSRFEEEKVHKPDRDLGPEVRFYGERCILCTRCVRFCQEETDTAELSVVNRGDRCEIDVFPGVELDNPLSGCVVDICPVGALVSRDFLHKVRVWYLEQTDSTCTSCSRGCSVSLFNEKISDTVFRGEDLSRIKPRYNSAVNRWWMCDRGRLNYKFVNENRLQRPVRNTDDGPEGLPWDDAVRDLAETLRGTIARHGEKSVAIVPSLHQTVEELWTVRRIVDGLGDVRTAFTQSPSGERWESKGGFVIDADHNPNRRGAELVFGAAPEVPEQGADAPAGDLKDVLDAARSGEVKALVLLSPPPDWNPSKDVLEALRACEFTAVATHEDGDVAAAADLVLAAGTFAERNGTIVNSLGLAQRLRPALFPPASARTDLDILLRLAGALELDLPVVGQSAADGGRPGVPRPTRQAGAVLEAVGADVSAFKDVTHDDLEPGGLPVDKGAPDPEATHGWPYSGGYAVPDVEVDGRGWTGLRRPAAVTGGDDDTTSDDGGED